MKKEIATLWVNALRSGKYEQTTGKLKRHGGYCCLGVLCELSGQGEFVDMVEMKDVYVLPSGMRGKTELPDEIVEWAGMSSRDGAIHPDYPSGITTLSAMNDDGSTFAEIADVIEENWETL